MWLVVFVDYFVEASIDHYLQIIGQPADNLETSSTATASCPLLVSYVVTTSKPFCRDPCLAYVD